MSTAIAHQSGSNAHSADRVGRRISMVTAAAGMSDREVAEALEDHGINISHETVRRTRNGSRPASIDLLGGIAQVCGPYAEPELGVDVMSWLFEGYPGNGGTAAGGAIPRQLKPQLATVTDILTKERVG